MDWIAFLEDTGLTILRLLWNITYIIIPILIAVEILKDLGWMRKFAQKAQGAMKRLRLPGESAFGLLVGMVIGLVFASGLMLKMKDEVPMTRRQRNAMFIVIGLAHALIEESIIFLVLGANPFWIVLTRLVFAFVAVFLYWGITDLADKIRGRRGGKRDMAAKAAEKADG